MDGDSGLLRRRTTRTSRELTPEPTRKERVSKSSDRENKTQQPPYTADESKYIVRGVLNVGPPSPAGSTSSSGSGGHGISHSGSQAYRAKLLRYFSRQQRCHVNTSIVESQKGLNVTDVERETEARGFLTRLSIQ